MAGFQEHSTKLFDLRSRYQSYFEPLECMRLYTLGLLGALGGLEMLKAHVQSYDGSKGRGSGTQVL